MKTDEYIRKLIKERDDAREYASRARLREKAAENKRIHDTDAIAMELAEAKASIAATSPGQIPIDAECRAICRNCGNEQHDQIDRICDVCGIASLVNVAILFRALDKIATK